MSSLKMDITGMSCGHCVAAVSRSLEAIDGVHSAQVEIGAATVEFDAGVVGTH